MLEIALERLQQARAQIAVVIVGALPRPSGLPAGLMQRLGAAASSQTYVELLRMVRSALNVRLVNKS